MICPVCKTNMIIVEYQDIELDYCTSCKGVWFDAGELELVFKTRHSDDEVETFLAEMIRAAHAETTEKIKKCPICGKKMDKKDIWETPRTLIDVCGKGHGLWFDGGEVIQLAEYMRKKEGNRPDSNNTAVEFLKEFFGTPE